METKSKVITPPSTDNRWKKVTVTMKKHNYSRQSLIETLHAVQDSFGFIDEEAMKFVSDSLGIPMSKVYGVTTFYNQFSTKPSGEHCLSLCTGTACYVKGNDKIIEFMKEEFNLNPGDTTEDNKLSFNAARCVGACGLAPVMILDGDVVGKLNVEDMKERIREWVKNG
jgi:bidirectional [NiFe] hydrogenase diaphorase subunit